VAVLVHSSGKFLYVANGGTNNISQFTLDPSTGLPALIAGALPATGTGPRFMVNDATGKNILVATETGDSITELKVDLTAGTLTVNQTVSTSVPPSGVVITK
jgi:6-phosphogluconolactonase (cycloisomerase 2 family)